MSDPAVEAAQRAWDALPEQSYATREQVMEAAAREALKPIRSLFDRLSLDYATASPEVQQGMDEVLNPLRHLIFSTEELER